MLQILKIKKLLVSMSFAKYWIKRFEIELTNCNKYRIF